MAIRVLFSRRSVRACGVLAGLLSGLIVGNASALECPSGQTPQLEFSGGGGPYANNTCSVGQVVPGPEACKPESYTADVKAVCGSPSITPDGLGANWNCQFYSMAGDACGGYGCYFQAGTWIATVVEVCLPEVPICPEAGTSIGFMTWAGSAASFPTCQESCNVAPVLGQPVNSYFSPTTNETRYTVAFETTGGDCSEPPVLGAGTAPHCDTINGVSVCSNVDAGDSSCITIDGVKSCYSDAGGVCDTPDCLASGEAFLAQSDGSAIAGEDVGTPPAPNNGTPGERATPDLTIGMQGGSYGPPGYTWTPNTGGLSGWGGSENSGNGYTYDYFTPETVAESEEEPEPSPTPGPSATPGPTASPGPECEPEDEECEESGNFTGPGGTAKTFSQSFEDLRSSVESAPIVVAMSGAGLGGISGGTCPPLVFTLPGWGQIGTNIHCELAEQLSALTGMMLALWALLGIRIVASA